MGSSGAGAPRPHSPAEEPAPAGAVLPCKACWIEVELRDEEENPVPNEPYWIRLADGSLREGRLNQAGAVRLDGIPCGTCLVGFPKYDAPGVNWAAAQASETRDWIEIAVVDTNGKPVPKAAYTIELPDGSSRSGHLSEQGKARLEGIPSGECKVKFPEIDKADFAGE